jgi:hypothetical protein
MNRICELQQASMALKSAQKERKVGKIKLRMDYSSAPGTVICNIKDGVGSISLQGINEIKGMINELQRLIGQD